MENDYMDIDMDIDLGPIGSEGIYYVRNPSKGKVPLIVQHI